MRPKKKRPPSIDFEPFNIGPLPEPLEPPDLKRCQAETSNGVTFMTLGGRPEMVRCGARSEFILTEATADEYERKGSMSVCEECLRAFIRVCPDRATVRRIRIEDAT